MGNRSSSRQGNNNKRPPFNFCDLVAHESLKIGFVGRSGAGKSSLINALLQQPEASPTGIEQTTLVSQSFPLDGCTWHDGVVLVDVPGMNTVQFPRETYASQVGLDNLHVGVVIYRGRLLSDDLDLAHEFHRRGKPFVFVRTCADQDVAGQGRRSGHRVSSEAVPTHDDHPWVADARISVRSKWQSDLEERNLWWQHEIQAWEGRQEAARCRGVGGAPGAEKEQLQHSGGRGNPSAPDEDKSSTSGGGADSGQCSDSENTELPSSRSRRGAATNNNSTDLPPPPKLYHVSTIPEHAECFDLPQFVADIRTGAIAGLTQVFSDDLITCQESTCAWTIVSRTPATSGPAPSQRRADIGE